MKTDINDKWEQQIQEQIQEELDNYVNRLEEEERIIMEYDKDMEYQEYLNQE